MPEKLEKTFEEEYRNKKVENIIYQTDRIIKKIIPNIKTPEQIEGGWESKHTTLHDYFLKITPNFSIYPENIQKTFTP
jgi:hypothetical protein